MSLRQFWVNSQEVKAKTPKQYIVERNTDVERHEDTVKEEVLESASDKIELALFAHMPKSQLNPFFVDGGRVGFDEQMPLVSADEVSAIQGDIIIKAQLHADELDKMIQERYVVIMPEIRALKKLLLAKKMAALDFEAIQESEIHLLNTEDDKKAFEAMREAYMEAKKEKANLVEQMKLAAPAVVENVEVKEEQEEEELNEEELDEEEQDKEEQDKENKMTVLADESKTTGVDLVVAKDSDTPEEKSNEEDTNKSNNRIDQSDLQQTQSLQQKIEQYQTKKNEIKKHEATAKEQAKKLADKLLASDIGGHAYARQFKDKPVNDIEAELKKRQKEAIALNKKLGHVKGKLRLEDGSTISSVMVARDKVSLAYIGDTRVYAVYVDDEEDAVTHIDLINPYLHNLANETEEKLLSKRSRDRSSAHGIDTKNHKFSDWDHRGKTHLTHVIGNNTMQALGLSRDANPGSRKSEGWDYKIAEQKIPEQGRVFLLTVSGGVSIDTSPQGIALFNEKGIYKSAHHSANKQSELRLAKAVVKFNTKKQALTKESDQEALTAAALLVASREDKYQPVVYCAQNGVAWLTAAEGSGSCRKDSVSAGVPQVAETIISERVNTLKMIHQLGESKSDEFKQKSQQLFKEWDSALQFEIKSEEDAAIAAELRDAAAALASAYRYLEEKNTIVGGQEADFIKALQKAAELDAKIKTRLSKWKPYQLGGVSIGGDSRYAALQPIWGQDRFGRLFSMAYAYQVAHDELQVMVRPVNRDATLKEFTDILNPELQQLNAAVPLTDADWKLAHQRRKVLGKLCAVAYNVVKPSGDEKEAKQHNNDPAVFAEQVKKFEQAMLALRKAEEKLSPVKHLYTEGTKALNGHQSSLLLLPADYKDIEELSVKAPDEKKDSIYQPIGAVDSSVENKNGPVLFGIKKQLLASWREASRPGISGGWKDYLEAQDRRTMIHAVMAAIDGLQLDLSGRVMVKPSADGSDANFVRYRKQMQAIRAHKHFNMVKSIVDQIEHTIQYSDLENQFTLNIPNGVQQLINNKNAHLKAIGQHLKEEWERAFDFGVGSESNLSAANDLRAVVIARAKAALCLRPMKEDDDANASLEVTPGKELEYYDALSDLQAAIKKIEQYRGFFPKMTWVTAAEALPQIPIKIVTLGLLQNQYNWMPKAEARPLTNRQAVDQATEQLVEAEAPLFRLLNDRAYEKDMPFIIKDFIRDETDEVVTSSVPGSPRGSRAGVLTGLAYEWRKTKLEKIVRVTSLQEESKSGKSYVLRDGITFEQYQKANQLRQAMIYFAEGVSYFDDSMTNILPENMRACFEALQKAHAIGIKFPDRLMSEYTKTLNSFMSILNQNMRAFFKNEQFKKIDRTGLKDAWTKVYYRDNQENQLIVEPGDQTVNWKAILTAKSTLNAIQAVREGLQLLTVSEAKINLPPPVVRLSQDEDAQSLLGLTPPQAIKTAFNSVADGKQFLTFFAKARAFHQSGVNRALDALEARLQPYDALNDAVYREAMVRDADVDSKEEKQKRHETLTQLQEKFDNQHGVFINADFLLEHQESLYQKEVEVAGCIGQLIQTVEVLRATQNPQLEDAINQLDSLIIKLQDGEWGMSVCDELSFVKTKILSMRIDLPPELFNKWDVYLEMMKQLLNQKEVYKRRSDLITAELRKLKTPELKRMASAIESQTEALIRMKRQAISLKDVQTKLRGMNNEWGAEAAGELDRLWNFAHEKGKGGRENFSAGEHLRDYVKEIAAAFRMIKMEEGKRTTTSENYLKMNALYKKAEKDMALINQPRGALPKYHNKMLLEAIFVIFFKIVGLFKSPARWGIFGDYAKTDRAAAAKPLASLKNNSLEVIPPIPRVGMRQSGGG